MLLSVLYSMNYNERKGHNISNILSKDKKEREKEKKGGRERERDGRKNLGKEYIKIFVQFLQFTSELYAKI